VKNEQMKYRALLFDFYGTIVEEADNYVTHICTEISHDLKSRASPHEIAAQWFKIVPRMCYDAFGPDFRLQKDIAVESLKEVLHSFQSGLDSYELMQVIRDYWTDPKIFPESKSVLAQCDLPVCIVTNADNEFIYEAIEKHGLTFTHVITSETCKSYKPRVEMFLKALSIVGVSREEALCIGDSLSNDVQGAKSAGIPVLWINRKNRKLRKRDVKPDYVSPDLCGVLEYLR
jgi:putative hydrolase of the HAD superfamily